MALACWRSSSPHGQRVISPRVMPFSQVIEQEWRRWLPFRRALSKEDQEAFDRMFTCAKLQFRTEVPLERRGGVSRARHGPSPAVDS